MRLAITTSLLAALACAVAGCGPDVDLGAGRATARDYARDADRICAQVAQRFNEIQSEDPQTFAQAGEIVAALLEVAADGEAELRALEPPRARAEAFRDYLDARADLIGHLESAADAAAAEDGAGYARAREAAVAASGERERLALRAGLSGCARAEAG